MSVPAASKKRSASNPEAPLAESAVLPSKSKRARAQTAPAQPSDLARRVYALTRIIPKGKVSTYGQISRLLVGHHRLSRAVGKALSVNPFAPLVPCHRVVRADRQIGGFFAHADPSSEPVRRKIALLRSEGVLFEEEPPSKNALVIAQESLFDWPKEIMELTSEDISDEALSRA